MMGDYDREHAKQLRDIELALDRIAAALESIAGKVEQMMGKDDGGRRFLRVVDIWRHHDE